MNVCSCFFLLTGAANENGNVAEDSETIPDQTPAEGSDAKPGDEPAEEPAVTAVSADTTAATPPAAEESQDAAGSPPAETSAAAGDSTAETAASSSEAEAPAPEPGRRESQTGMRLNTHKRPFTTYILRICNVLMFYFEFFCT